MQDRLKIVVTGGNGQLGTELKSFSGLVDRDFVFTDLPELNLTDHEQVRKFIAFHRPDYCINCAAYTAVDRAESDRGNALGINVNAVNFLSSACEEFNVRLFHISTDFVFPGNTSRPLTENDIPAPVNYYGETKLMGENICLEKCRNSIIIRTSWLYSPFGQNFVKTMLRVSREKDRLNIVFDQVGTPTYAHDLAGAIVTMINRLNSGRLDFESMRGIYHYSNEGIASWFDFAVAVFDIAKIDIRLNPILTEQYPTPAKRPYYSVLDKSKIKQAFGIEIPHWRDSLVQCLDRMPVESRR
jgi:dTDP-4-dehydrorhamnose reductase